MAGHQRLDREQGRAAGGIRQSAHGPPEFRSHFQRGEVAIGDGDLRSQPASDGLGHGGSDGPGRMVPDRPDVGTKSRWDHENGSLSPRPGLESFDQLHVQSRPVRPVWGCRPSQLGRQSSGDGRCATSDHQHYQPDRPGGEGFFLLLHQSHQQPHQFRGVQPPGRIGGGFLDGSNYWYANGGGI